MGSTSAQKTHAILQVAAEAYLNTINLNDRVSFIQLTRRGNNHPSKNPKGLGTAKLTRAQAEWLFDNYEIVMHYPSDASGFSATLFRERASGAYTLSLRSTESAFGPQDQARDPSLPDLGGDWARDGKPGADGEINAYGYALGQIDSMDRLYTQLRAGRRWDEAARAWVDDARLDALRGDGANAPLTVTGYSLGGHLATTFALLHPEALTTAYT